MRAFRSFGLVVLLACTSHIPVALAEAAPAKSGAPTTEAALSAYAKKADALVREAADGGLFSGAVLVAVDGKPVLRRAYGLANREWNAPVTLDTEFRIGSMTKQFTAAAILQLAEQGELGLDDPINKFYPGPDAWKEITLRQLLTHSSGIPNYTGMKGVLSVLIDQRVTPEQLIAISRDAPLDFPPGTKAAYSNTGYVLLGYVIEKISGEKYADYLQAHILGPLGMTHTGYDFTGPLLPHRASGYAMRETTITNAQYVAMEHTHAAGALYSTVDDLLIWDQALYTDKVLSAESRKAMFTDYGQGWGLGYEIKTENGRRVWSHGGKIYGFLANMTRFPDQHLTVIVLSNQLPSPQISTSLIDLYFGDSTHQAHPINPASLDRYVGTYISGPDAVVTISRKGNRLFGHAKGWGLPPIELFADSEKHFFTKFFDLQVTFEGSAPGKMTSVAFRRDEKVTEAKRAAAP